MTDKGKNYSTRDKGKWAEDVASAYLIEKGYEIVKKNFHFGRIGEIDIIAKYDDALIFVEVKSRASDSFGGALESITPRKQKSIKRVAEGYYYVNKIHDAECRFDVITVDAISAEVEHFERAFF